eukprot:6492106-Amphidinium_carterae.2
MTPFPVSWQPRSSTPRICWYHRTSNHTRGPTRRQRWNRASLCHSNRAPESRSDPQSIHNKHHS